MNENPSEMNELDLDAVAAGAGHKHTDRDEISRKVSEIMKTMREAGHTTNDVLEDYIKLYRSLADRISRPD